VGGIEAREPIGRESGYGWEEQTSHEYATEAA
jgi:hypothetical protein